MKEMGREATVREVEVEEMVHQREKQTGWQGCKVHLFKLNGYWGCWDSVMGLPGRVTKSEVKERTQEQVEGLPIGQWRVQ